MDIFDVAFDMSEHRPMDFDTTWRTANGSYVPLAERWLGPPPGSLLTAVSPEGERLAIVVTPFGNVVLVEADRNHNYAVVHALPKLQGIWGRGKLTDDQIESILGLWGKDNIGTLLAKLIDYEGEPDFLIQDKERVNASCRPTD